MRQRLARLQASIAQQCGEQHEYVKQRDDTFPFCKSCGYSDYGLHLSDIPDYLRH